MPLSTAQLSQQLLPGGLHFTLTREFAAPKQLLWKLYTEADHLAHWWSPKNEKTTIVELDLHRSGAFRFERQSPERQTPWSKWIYLDIQPMKLLTYFQSFTDAHGKTIRSPENPKWPMEMYGTITFEASPPLHHTIITHTLAPWNASEQEHQTFNQARLNMKSAFQKSWDQLETYLTQLTINNNNTSSP
ncbi:SRPBCC family protein [Phragmitibacter flavus]|nr:SRPBCC domain-containing protein [Phragmitibacter flavus]